MKKSELKAITAKGEDSRLQFKKDIRNVGALAAEMVTFSNFSITVTVACSPPLFTERDGKFGEKFGENPLFIKTRTGIGGQGNWPADRD